MSDDIIGCRVEPGAGGLGKDAVADALTRGLQRLPLEGARVLVLIPDGTRTFPAAQMFRQLTELLRPRVRRVDFMVALGTHPPLSPDRLLALVGLDAAEKAARYADVGLFNHAWNDPAALTTLGTISADEIGALSGGRLRLDVAVRLNRAILDYDHLIVCGPVFPHEVVGFSGGNKYFFPGIAGRDIIDFTHWLGALVTSYATIGTKDTAVRRVIDRATNLIPRPRHAICSVVTHHGLVGLFVGPVEAAWSAAADLSARHHMIWTDRTYDQVLSVLPPMYDELWVGGKGMYKTEPAVADGGEVILYAPHLREVSVVHGRLIRQIGYHVRDYFTAQWDRFRALPWGVVAHSTHVKGNGTYEGGVERPRINVTLATGIPADECRSLNLGYRDPATVDPAAFAGRESEGVLLVPKAGEYLYRPKNSTAPRA
ncbi:MAG TPA: lactate racemase domain-containing protein [Polyangia bacterium]|nr:lactate racemase domain-containing protein [Polyangia bacterium]